MPTGSHRKCTQCDDPIATHPCPPPLLPNRWWNFTQAEGRLKVPLVHHNYTETHIPVIPGWRGAELVVQWDCSVSCGFSAIGIKSPVDICPTRTRCILLISWTHEWSYISGKSVGVTDGVKFPHPPTSATPSRETSMHPILLFIQCYLVTLYDKLHARSVVHYEM